MVVTDTTATLRGLSITLDDVRPRIADALETVQRGEITDGEELAKAADWLRERAADLAALSGMLGDAARVVHFPKASEASEAETADVPASLIPA